MGNKKILVVDDEADLREILMFNLESEGYDVEVACSGEEALVKMEDPFDLVILDIMMGGISGLRVAEKMRRELSINTPIIFLTAKVSENDMLTGFSIGADDYITKPFSVKEVSARCKAILKRSEINNNRETTTVKKDKVVIDNLLISIIDMQVYIDKEEVILTKKEYEILVLLTTNIGRTYSRDEILDKVWNNDSYVLERTIDVHITRLRKKLGVIGARITNRSGYGYCFK